MKKKCFEIINKMSFSQKLILFFFITVLIGAILLKMPFSLKENQNISFLTSLFTITSAICVTGLSIIDIGNVLSLPGQIIVLIFIQLGGLGIMTFSSIFFFLTGKKISYKGREIIREERNAENCADLIFFIKRIIFIVLGIEGIGAIFLTIKFLDIFPLDKAIYYGIFHSISAFCNAGFSLFSNSLESYRINVLLNLIIAFLIISGGLGFGVIDSAIANLKNKMKRRSITSRMAIIVTTVLLFLGTFLFLLFEYNNTKTIGNLNLFYKIVVSFFQSTTTRTAGFNTINMDDLTPNSIFLTYILMFIGASPGSTGGGVKTTTIGVIFIYVLTIIQNEENVNIFKRRIKRQIIDRALTILILSIIYVLSIIMLMMVAEEGMSHKKIIFEVISAFSTTGLSMGITAELSSISHIFLIITMFVGRLGPLTFALALGKKAQIKNLRYPSEDILVG